MSPVKRSCFGQFTNIHIRMYHISGTGRVTDNDSEEEESDNCVHSYMHIHTHTHNIHTSIGSSDARGSLHT